MSAPTNITMKRKPQAEYQKELKEHQEKKDRELMEQMSATNLQANTVGGILISEEMTVEVDCPVPGYTDIKCHFRTNNNTERFLKQPRLIYSNEYHAKNERLSTIAKDIIEQKVEFSEEYANLTVEVEAMRVQEYTAYIKRRCEWLALFLKRVSPWRFGYATAWDAEGKATEAALYPVLNPHDPSTYVVLFTEHEPLGLWAEGEGYQEAVAKVSAPFSRVSPARSS